MAYNNWIYYYKKGSTWILLTTTVFNVSLFTDRLWCRVQETRASKCGTWNTANSRYRWVTRIVIGFADWPICLMVASWSPDVVAECFIYGQRTRGKLSVKWEHIRLPLTPSLSIVPTSSRLLSKIWFFVI